MLGKKLFETAAILAGGCYCDHASQLGLRSSPLYIIYIYYIILYQDADILANKTSAPHAPRVRL